MQVSNVVDFNKRLACADNAQCVHEEATMKCLLFVFVLVCATTQTSALFDSEDPDSVSNNIWNGMDDDDDQTTTGPIPRKMNSTSPFNIMVSCYMLIL